MPLLFVRNDITRMKVDAIVNAANPTLLGGGGVDGAIHRAAGPELLEKCRTLNGCRTGEAKITPGYRLSAKYVIHTVGPVWEGGTRGEPGLLASCYRNSLALAREAQCESIAFPMISTGVYGYPKAEALQIAVREINSFLAENEMTVYLVVFGPDTLARDRAFAELTSFIDNAYEDKYPLDQKESLPPAQPSFNASYTAPPQAMVTEAPEKPVRKKRRFLSLRRENSSVPAQGQAPASSEKESLEDMLRKMDDSFSVVLMRRIAEKNMTDAECYRRANIDRRLFNKIKNVPGYRPGKLTVLAFAVALELSLEETRDMLERAGYSLTHASKTDIVVEYCITHNIYDITQINEYLFDLDLQLLGSSAS